MEEINNIVLLTIIIYVSLGVSIGVLISIRRYKQHSSKKDNSKKPVITSAIDNAYLVNGKYELISPPHRQGGMATIWYAVECKTGKPCIIKTPRRGTSIDNTYLDKLMLEAKYLKKINHPCIVRYIDDFYYKGEFHLVIEYIDGETLLTASPRTPFQEHQVIFWGCQLLDALSYIHDRGIFHRDINPKNIMLSGDGMIKLIDFGTAKTMNDNNKKDTRNLDPFTQITNRGFDIPELMSGESDQRCDLCGLAQTCIYLLTLKQPNEICSSLFKFNWPRSYEEARILAEYLIANGISKRTARLLAQAIIYSPDNRFANTRAMQAALSSIDVALLKSSEPILQK